MGYSFWRKVRRLSLSWHRDLGYFFTPLIIIYSVSGIALNHLDDFDPDFVIEKKEIKLPKVYEKSEITDEVVNEFGKMVGEDEFKIYDFPTDNRLKIYYDNASLQITFSTKEGQYDRITKRHVIYETNVLHRNSLHAWKWVADIFAIMLIVISITGAIILKGKYGFKRRGWWLMFAGFILPVVGVILFYATL